MTGTLPMPEPEPQDPLIAAVYEVRAGRGDMNELMALFAAAALWVETEPAQGTHTVRAVVSEGLRWLPVFSSPTVLAAFAQASGRGDQEVHYGRLSGAEIIDECLPGLPPGTGMLLDPTSDHVLTLPAVPGIVATARTGQGVRRGA